MSYPPPQVVSGHDPRGGTKVEAPRIAVIGGAVPRLWNGPAAPPFAVARPLLGRNPLAVSPCSSYVRRSMIRLPIWEHQADYPSEQREGDEQHQDGHDVANRMGSMQTTAHDRRGLAPADRGSPSARPLARRGPLTMGIRGRGMPSASRGGGPCQALDLHCRHGPGDLRHPRY